MTEIQLHVLILSVRQRLEWIHHAPAGGCWAVRRRRRRRKRRRRRLWACRSCNNAEEETQEEEEAPRHGGVWYCRQRLHKVLPLRGSGTLARGQEPSCRRWQLGRVRGEDIDIPPPLAPSGLGRLSGNPRKVTYVSRTNVGVFARRCLLATEPAAGAPAPDRGSPQHRWPLTPRESETPRFTDSSSEVCLLAAGRRQGVHSASLPGFKLCSLGLTVVGVPLLLLLVTDCTFTSLHPPHV